MNTMNLDRINLRRLAVASVEDHLDNSSDKWIAEGYIAALEELREVSDALYAVTTNMDRASGNQYGSSECPWCGEEGSLLPFAHNENCGLVRARSVLAKLR